MDGVIATDDERNLTANLLDRMGRMHSGSYDAPPVRRHRLPKDVGEWRPLGLPTVEDKMAQRAIVMILEPIDEADFLPCSYGFRPDRSAHGALSARRDGLALGDCDG